MCKHFHLLFMFSGFRELFMPTNSPPPSWFKFWFTIWSPYSPTHDSQGLLWASLAVVVVVDKPLRTASASLFLSSVPHNGLHHFPLLFTHFTSIRVNGERLSERERENTFFEHNFTGKGRKFLLHWIVFCSQKQILARTIFNPRRVDRHFGLHTYYPKEKDKNPKLQN